MASLPSYHRLDMRVRKTWHRKGVANKRIFSKFSMYTTAKISSKLYNPAGDDVQEARQFPIIPYIGLTIEF